MSVFFNEFEGNPTPTFYAIMVLSIGLFFMVVYKYFSKKTVKYKCDLTFKNADKGGFCFDKNKDPISNVSTLYECCDDKGIKNENTWRDVSHLAQNCTGTWNEMYSGKCVQNSDGVGIACNNAGFKYERYQIIKPAKYGGNCPFSDGEMKETPCVNTCVTNDCSNTNHDPVCDSSGRVVGFNPCFASASGFTEFAPCSAASTASNTLPNDDYGIPSDIIDIEHCVGTNNSYGLDVCDKNNNRIAINACVALETVDDYTGFDGVNYKFCNPMYSCTKEYNPMCDKNNKVVASNECMAFTLGYKTNLLRPCNKLDIISPPQENPVPSEDNTTPIEEKPTPVGIYPVPIENTPIPVNVPIENTPVPSEQQNPVPVGIYPIPPENTPVGIYPVPPENTPVGIYPVPPENTPVGIYPVPPENTPVGIYPVPIEENPVPVNVPPENTPVPVPVPIENTPVPVNVPIENTPVPSEQQNPVPVGIYPIPPENTPVPVPVPIENTPVPVNVPIENTPIPVGIPTENTPVPVPVPEQDFDECENTTFTFDPVCDMFGQNIFIAANKCIAKQAGYTKFVPCENKFGNTICTTEHRPVCDKNNIILANNSCFAMKKGHHPDSFQLCE